MGSSPGQQTIQGACVSETAVHGHGRRLDQREFRPMAEVPFRPARQFSEYKGKGASARRKVIYISQGGMSLFTIHVSQVVSHGFQRQKKSQNFTG